MDLRGESRGSYGTGSQYSESTVINQDITDPDLFPSELGYKGTGYQPKVVGFKSPGLPTKPKEPDDHVQLQGPIKPSYKVKGIDLMARLVDRPENSQALRMAKGLGPIKRGPPKSPQPESPKPGMITPHPPEPKREMTPPNSFRTTMFKRDYQRRQLQIKAKNDQPLEEPKLTVGMLHKPKAKEVIPPSTPGDAADYTENEDLEVFAELVELMGTNAENADKKSDTQDDSKPTTPAVVPDEKSEDMSPLKSESVPPSTGMSREEEDMDVMLVKYPGEMPIIDTQKVGRVMSATKERPGSRPTSGTKRPTDSAKGTRKTVLLTYLHKNKYDDKAPENTNVMENIIQLREKLGWKTEIPRHGPGCKDAMEKLTDRTVNEKDRKKLKEDDGQFVYCLQKHRKNRRARYDPYDLEVVSANVARAEKIYWTVSASFITMCTQHENGSEESVNTPVLWWLWERRLFYMIYKLPVFVKFRLWKTFKMWKRNMRLQKSSASRTVIYKTLFVANEVLQGCLIHVRGLCEAASGSLTGVGQGDSAICLIKLDRTQTFTLTEFKEIQQKQGGLALEQLNVLRSKIIDIVWESCATVAEMEGITTGIRPEGSKKVKIKVPEPKDEVEVMTSKLKLEQKYGGTKMKEKKDDKKRSKPLYAEIAEWRKILNRLAGFLRSVDYLVLEMLRRLVVTAVRHMLDHMISSYNVTEEDEEKVQDDSSEISSDIWDFGQAIIELNMKDDDNDSVNSDKDDRPDSKADSGSRNSSNLMKPVSRSSSEASFRVPSQPGQKQDKKTYEIPRFDFDQIELVEAPPDVQEVMNELKERDKVEIITAPMFSLQLVLNVPQKVSGKATSDKGHGHKKEHVDRMSSQSSRLKQVFMDKESVSTKKTVKFTDDHDSSGSESDDESDDSDDEDKEKDDDDDSQSDEEYEAKNTNRFAYPGGEQKKEKASTKSHISLSPSEYELKMGIKDIISGFENTIAQVVSMLREPKLKVFYSPPQNDLKLNFDEEEEEERREMQRPWPDLEFMFSDDPEYQSILTDIGSYMAMELELVKQYIIIFQQFCVMVDKSSKLDVDASMIRRQWSTEEFSHVLKTHTDMVREMKKMTTSRRVAMIQVQSKIYRDSCLPHPEFVIKRTHQHLPIIANKRNEDLLTIIKGASKKLDHKPGSVEEFVEHLSFLAKMSAELPALDKEFNVVNKLFTIADQYTVDIHPEVKALWQTLGRDFQHLKSSILYSEAKKDENIRKFSRDLDHLIYDIRAEIMDLKNRVRDPDLLHIDMMAVSALEKIRDLQEKVQILSVKARSYGSYQERFGSSMTHSKKGMYGYIEEYLALDKPEDQSAKEIETDLSEIERDLTLRRLLWQSQEEWMKLEEGWKSTIFDSLQVDNLQKNVNRFTQTVYMLEKGLPHNEVVPKLKEVVMNFKQGMPVITSLRNPSLRARHWAEIEKLIGKAVPRDKEFTLGKLLEMNIFTHKEKIQDISTQASNEATLELMLQKIIDIWQATDFRLVPHAGRDTFIIGSADDIIAQLEESQVTIGTIRGSRYVGPIKSQVEQWETKLTNFSNTLDKWLTCQRNWLYLEQIFSTPDIQRGQLAGEYKMFTSVDKSWKDIMRRVEDRPNALKSALAPGTLETLQTCNDTLEKISKCLEDYLEFKRGHFPRFYFLSNDELLEILAQSKDPNAVQPHLGKCFGNIKSLEIKPAATGRQLDVRSMTSDEGEIVAMPKNVRVRGSVEMWLVNVESGMFETVKKHLKQGLADWDRSALQEWVLSHPGQVVLTMAQIMFNKNVLNCFEHSNPCDELVKVRENMITSLNHLAGLVSEPLLTHQRMSIEALLTINVHSRDILTTMIEDKVTKSDDFDWTKQLRYEWDEQTNNCLVMQSNATFNYGYEYLGCSARLVITPLTDRCYLTLTGALHLYLGGSPAGPAGTGKTETVKDLAKAVGKQCVVFNCSEGLDYKTLGKFFSGLAQSGSWCCFDEFNRIDVEVLSVVAQQIMTIKNAKATQQPRFLFDGKDIKLNATCGYFITMNPTEVQHSYTMKDGQVVHRSWLGILWGYAGRVELPDNLQSLFRPVAMMVPDYGLIAEIMLFSEGFIAAKSLSRKIVNLYQLASRQLSQQDHYDFGMRAIKSVLVMAGHGRQHVQIKNENHKILSEEEESYILIHSLRDANLPKFLAEDVPLFESILADLFPGIVPPEPDQGVLEKAINMAVRDQGLQLWPNQAEKVKQFYNQILVRHGIMLVGPTGGGKTTIRNILQKALILLPTILPHTDHHQESGKRASVFMSPDSFYSQCNGDVESFLTMLVSCTPPRPSRGKKGQVEVFSVNPKCVKLGELYGETDPNTFEWTDGLIASATRKFAKELTLGVDEHGRPISGTSESHDDLGDTDDQPTKQHVEPFDLSRAASQMEHDGEPEKRELADPMLTAWRWLVLDGPVDTLWVENLNTVLDDSKVLCLASGERISLASGMRLVFEVDNLSKASPATISRCAMVYVDPVDLGWRPYTKTWLQRLPRDLPESGRHHLQQLFDHSIEKGLRFFRKYYKEQLVPAPEMSLIMCLCNILSAFFDFMGKNGGFGNPDKEETMFESVDGRSESRASSRSSSRAGKAKTSKKRQPKQRYTSKFKDVDESSSVKSSSSSTRVLYLQKSPGQLLTLLGKLYVFAFTWSIGGNFKRQEDMDEDDSLSRRGTDRNEKREINICNEFDNFMHELFEVEPPLGVRLPTGNRTIYSYFIDMESGNFVPWDALVPTTKSLIEKGAVITIGETMGVSGDHRKKREETDITQTVDIVRFSFLTGLLLLNKHPVLITGESGVGKSAIINYMLERLKKEGGTTTRSGTVIGDVLSYSDKHASLLENISNLTKFGDEDEDEESKKNIDFLLGTAKPKPTIGIISSVIQFSAQTTSSRLQSLIMHKLIKKGRDHLGAPKGKKVLVFVDDLNMPAPEDFGAQPPLELLRQYLELGGFYDTKKLVWKDIMDVTVVAACGPPGGGRNPVSPRLLKHFCMLALPQPSTRSLQHIYQVQLGRFFQEGDFATEVRELLFPMVSASIAVYYKMCSSMLPTPAKSHYTFNIRDLSKIIQGLLQAHESVIVSRDNVAQLFAHEATRIFHDRLTNHEDRTFFFTFLADNLHDFFKVKWSAKKLMDEQVLFGDFFQLEEKSDRIYHPITDRKKLSQILEEYYLRMNYGNTKTSQMVFFKDAVEHLTRAARVFRQPGGHMMLVGMDGTGKSTVVQLATHIAMCELFKLNLHRGYNTLEFRDDLKKAFKMSGVKGTNVVFLLTDADIVKESFLEDINCILNSGEVPDLFDNEELDGITMDLKHAATEADIPDTRPSVYQFFISRVRKNLHVVLTMSPAGGKFRQRCRMNPALINCCTIDWYDEWDDEAMLSVAKVFFGDEEFIADESYDLQELKQTVGRVCVDIHKSIGKMAKKYWEEMRRHYYSTPSSYMELIRVYSKMLKDNKTEFMNNRSRLKTGLDKLSNANVLVGEMQDELRALGPAIVVKQHDTEMLLEQLQKDQAAVEQVREIVEQEESVMVKEKQIVQDYADECQRDLASVLPALTNAIKSLETLDKADIAEIRVYNSPPVLVMTVMAAVCVLFQKKPDWPTAKQMLGDPNFLKKLLNFDKNSLPDKVFYKLKKYSKHRDFNPEDVGNVSGACRSICEWVLALEHYNEVYKMVKPKQKRVEEAQEALQLAENSLMQKQQSLQKIMDHLTMLQQQYTDSVNQRESLQDRQVKTGLRLDRAGILITSLENEKGRWAESVKMLDFKLQGLVGDTLIGAAAVAYIGPFTARYRRDLITHWVSLCSNEKIPISKNYDLIKNTVDAHQVLKWQNEGLPRDSHSTENALIVKKARKWALFIDPQGQASNWIKEMEGGNSLKIVSALDPNYMKTLETAIQVGDPMLLKDVTESLDPALRPCCYMRHLQGEGYLSSSSGDTEIEYNENFRLYMTTSMANPHFLPSIYIQVNIINFTVTFEGLQEQLLSSVVGQEKPILEKQRSELLESIASDLQFLRDMENKTLSLLQKPEENILDDQDLVDTLQKSKGMAAEMYHRVSQSEETEQKLSQARQRYLPVATRGATLYFVLADLAGIDVMYQFSLEWFQDMFESCISNSNAGMSPSVSPTDMRRKSSVSAIYHGTIRPASRKTSRANIDMSKTALKDSISETQSPQELKIHMLDMINRLTSSIYRVVSVALFANHQLTFSFMLCSSIMRAHAKYEDITNVGVIEDFEWQVFLQGNVMANMLDDKLLEEHDGLTAMERLEKQAQSGDKESQKQYDPPNWVSDAVWRQCQHLDTTIKEFKNLCRSILKNEIQWKVFHDSDDPYKLMNNKFDPSKFDQKAKITEVGTIMDWENLTRFQRLLLIKILRPESLTEAVSRFVIDQIGSSYMSTGTFDLKEIFEDSSAKTPLIFILSPGLSKNHEGSYLYDGTDPAAQLLRFAKELRGSTLHLDMISLGRGQGPKATELITKAQILKGRWVFLQNCHLAASWMPQLQAIVEKLNQNSGDDVDQQFRLWLSSKPDPCFPVSILQTGMKMTVEPPQGLKANMLRTFGSGGTGVVTEKMYNETDKGPAWAKLLFGLCLFNSVLHERKKYGRLGWNISYGFNDSDLEVSMQQLEILLKEHSDIPWKALTYLIGEVTYGGRVTDEWDGRCLHSLLGRFFCPDALGSEYSYSPDGIYKPVQDGYSFPDVCTYLESLPNYDSPEVFGMNENAEKACRQNQAYDLIDTIVSVQPRLSLELLGSEKTNDEIVTEIATDIMHHLPESVDVIPDKDGPGQPSFQSVPRPSLKNILIKEAPDLKDKKMEAIMQKAINMVVGNSALMTVLRQEIDRFNNLLAIIHKSLNLLALAVKGEIIMSDMLEEAYGALLSQKVPQSWQIAAYESCKPLGSWVQDLVRRVDFFTLWAEMIDENVAKVIKSISQSQQSKSASTPDLTEGDLILKNQPRSFWLSGFFFPQGFLTGILQNHARKLGISVDSLVFNFEVKTSKRDTEETLNDLKHKITIKEAAFTGNAAPDDGVLIFGLYFDGARWDPKAECLCESLPGQRFSCLPEIHFKPVQISSTLTTTPDKQQTIDMDAKSTKVMYECPLYRTSARAGTLSSTGHSTNFVTAVSLPSDHSPDFWVMRGVALLCQLDD